MYPGTHSGSRREGLRDQDTSLCLVGPGHGRCPLGQRHRLGTDQPHHLHCGVRAHSAIRARSGFWYSHRRCLPGHSVGFWLLAASSMPSIVERVMNFE